MTTTVIDRKNRILTCDSRWSISLSESLLAYVDNTEFDKIANRGHASLICAGDGRLIEAWKTWFSTPILNMAALPATDRTHNGQTYSINLSILLKPACTTIFASGWYLPHEEHAEFFGSGAPHARDCYSQNGCARRAVLSAGAEDPATGGDTKFVCFVTDSHNLSASKNTLADVMTQINERGMVMDTTTKNVVPIQEFGAKGADALRAIANGDLTVSAPTGQPARAWLESEKNDLRKALQHIADLEAADRA